ncbi:hypothetical protein ACFL2J_04880 [Candidatus Omnitrophota bacterium]
MKLNKYLLVLTVFLGIVVLWSSPGFALEMNDNWEMSITNRLNIYHNEISGPGGSNSFLYLGNDGWSYEDRLDILNKLTLDDVLYELDTEVSFTNNERIDIEDVSPKKLYFKRKSPDTLFQVGDFFANFSQYSLTQNLKGGIFSILKKEKDSWDASVVGGTYKPRWEYVWNDSSSELKNTSFYGLRGGRSFGPLTTHLNYVFTDEDRMKDIVPSNTSRSTTNVVHNHLWSLDWRFRPDSGFDISGESAASRRHATTNADVDLGYAHKIRGRFRINDFRSNLEYERTPSDFHSPGGSVSIDRERYRIQNKYYIGKSELFADYTAYWDNVQNTSAETTKVKMPEVGSRIRNFLNRKTLQCTVRVSQRRRHQSSNSLDERTDTASISLEDRLGPFRPSFGYEFRTIDLRKDPNDSGEKTQTIRLGLNSYHRTERWTFRPSLAVRHEQADVFGAGSDRGKNINWYWSGGLNMSFKQDSRLNLSYSYSDVDNYIFDSDSRKGTLRCSFSHSIGGSRDNVISFDYSDNKNGFSQANNEYEEKIWKVSWLRRF